MTPQHRVNGSATPAPALAVPATTRISKTAHLSPNSNPNPPRDSPSPSPQPPPRHGLGIAGYQAVAASSPLLNSAKVDAEEADADLVNASEADDEPAGKYARGHNRDSDDEDADIDFDDGMALPPSQALVPTPSMHPYHSPAVHATGAATGFMNSNAGVVSSEEEDDDEDEDFADLANDLETSLVPTERQAPQQITKSAQPNGRTAPNAIVKKYDSDIASSSESDDD